MIMYAWNNKNMKRFLMSFFLFLSLNLHSMEKFLADIEKRAAELKINPDQEKLDKLKEDIASFKSSINHLKDFYSPEQKLKRKLEIDLLQSCKYGDLEKVKELLLKGVNINCTDQFLRTSLIEAVLEDKNDIIEFLIKNNANVNHKTDNGGTALIYATRNNNSKALILLLSAGANIDLITKENLTALDVAKINGFKEIVEILENFKKTKKIISDSTNLSDVVIDLISYYSI